MNGGCSSTHWVDMVYGEGAGDPAVQEHLARCSACQERVVQLRALRQVSGADLAAFLPVEIRGQAVLSPAVRTPGWMRTGHMLPSMGLALVSLGIFLASPHHAPSHPGVSVTLFLAWTALYLWIMSLGSEPGSPDRLVSGRAVAYGVLASVMVSVTMLGASLVIDGLTHHIRFGIAWYCWNSVVLLGPWFSLAVVGLGFGAFSRDLSPRNMLAVLVLYHVIMLPALSSVSPAVSPSRDILFLAAMGTLWGLSGAYLGQFLSGLGQSSPTPA